MMAYSINQLGFTKFIIRQNWVAIVFTITINSITIVIIAAVTTITI